MPGTSDASSLLHNLLAMAAVSSLLFTEETEVLSSSVPCPESPREVAELGFEHRRALLQSQCSLYRSTLPSSSSRLSFPPHPAPMPLTQAAWQCLNYPWPWYQNLPGLMSISEFLGNFCVLEMKAVSKLGTRSFPLTRGGIPLPIS